MSDQEFVLKLWEITVNGLSWPITLIVVAYMAKLALATQIPDTPIERTDASRPTPKDTPGLSSLQVRPTPVTKPHGPPVSR